MEKKIWFTSDTHFGHNKEFLYQPRGFVSISDHDWNIIRNWNSVVGIDDEVYHLGDVMLNDNDYGLHCLSQLNGKIHIICGNHDTKTRAELYDQCINVVEVCQGAKELKIGKKYFWLCHYPTITANCDDNKPWAKHLINIYGHTHQKDKFYHYPTEYAEKNIYMYCVCLDAHNNYPVELNEILTDIIEEEMWCNKLTIDEK